MLSDGFDVDENGFIWTSTMFGIAIIDPTTSEQITRVHFGTAVSNVVLGENGIVYVAGAGNIWKLKRK